VYAESESQPGFVLAGVACILKKMNRKEVVVAVDGSLYRFHPFFHDLMMEKTKVLTPGIEVSTDFCVIVLFRTVDVVLPFFFLFFI
jgi:hypothetical protein